VPVQDTRVPKARTRVFTLAAHQAPLRFRAVVDVHIVCRPVAFAPENNKRVLVQHSDRVPPAAPRPNFWACTSLAPARPSRFWLILPGQVA
jgi:hypothetical protein